jgi:hypothetical protein
VWCLSLKSPGAVKSYRALSQLEQARKTNIAT